MRLLRRDTMLLPKYNSAKAIMPRSKDLYRQLKASSITLRSERVTTRRKGALDEAGIRLSVEHVRTGDVHRQRAGRLVSRCRLRALQVEREHGPFRKGRRAAPDAGARLDAEQGPRPVMGVCGSA